MHVSVNTIRLADSYAALDADRSGFQRAFVDLMCDQKTTLGRLLDVGCGSGLPPYLSRVGELAEEHDGVEPFADELARHPLLNRRFAGRVESVELPAGYYDTALAYNVAEHVDRPAPFLAAVRRALRPGGEFWILTPHARHPFAILSNVVRLANVKSWYRSFTRGVNAYESYYRLNSVASIRGAAEGQRWSRLDFWYVPCAQWDMYVPRPLRFVAHAYDRAIGQRYGRGMLLLICRATAE